MAFVQWVDVANRALQHLGRFRISSLADASPQAKEVNACFDNLRAAELQANTWYFAIKRARLRSIASTTQLFTPSAWAIATAYTIGQIVSYANYVWILTVATSTGDQPDTSAKWEHYWGPLTADTFDSTSSYEVGELAIGSNSSVYACLVNGTSNDPTTSSDWVLLAGTKAAYKILWPLNVGTNQGSGFAYNAYRLPNGFLRRAPADPKSGRFSILGAPSGLAADDYVFESGLLLSRDAGPIILRFVADIWDVNSMHPMFCEALAARIATEICGSLVSEKERLTEIRQSAGAHYRQELFRAKNADALVQGAVQPSTDEYITCRW